MDTTQKGVARGVISALIVVIAVFSSSVAFLPRAWPLASDLWSRIELAAWMALLPVLTLLICVVRLANHRFATPEDIHGSGLTSGTERAKLLQALLQNTLEQSCVALPVYLATAVVAPPALLPLVPAAALMFLIGRLAFFGGYAKGAPGRAFGFGLTFYPPALLLLLLLGLGVLRLAGR